MISVAIFFLLWFFLFSVSLFSILARKLESKVKPIEVLNVKVTLDSIVNSFVDIGESIQRNLSPIKIENANTYMDQIKISSTIKKMTEEALNYGIEYANNDNNIHNNGFATIRPEHCIIDLQDITNVHGTEEE